MQEKNLQDLTNEERKNLTGELSNSLVSSIKKMHLLKK